MQQNNGRNNFKHRRNILFMGESLLQVDGISILIKEETVRWINGPRKDLHPLPFFRFFPDGKALNGRIILENSLPLGKGDLMENIHKFCEQLEK